MGDQKGGDKTSPPRYVKTWVSSVAHSPYPRSKHMTSACREHSARDRVTAHGGVRELEGVSPISMGIGEWSQRWASERKDTVRLCPSSFLLTSFFIINIHPKWRVMIVLPMRSYRKRSD